MTSSATTPPEMPFSDVEDDHLSSPPPRAPDGFATDPSTPPLVIPDNREDIIQAALDYNARRFVLVPWGHQKMPLGTWETVSLETNDAALETLSKPYTTDRNGRPLYPQLAIQCAKSGLCVFDVDAKADKKTGITGFESLQELEDEFGPLPRTPTAQSHSRGKHFYFLDERYPKKTQFRPGIDIQCFGSCIIAPPTINSMTGNAYQWLPGLGLKDAALALAPDWLRNALRAIEDGRKHQWNGVGTGNGNSNGSTAPRPKLTGYDADTSPIYEGQRDDTVFRLACSHRAKGMDYAQMVPLLLRINQERCQPPLPDSQVLQKAQSACRYPPGWTGETTDESGSSRPAPGVMFDLQAFDKLHTMVKEALASKDTSPLFTEECCQLWCQVMDLEQEALFELLYALGDDFNAHELQKRIKAAQQTTTPVPLTDTELIIRKHLGELTEVGNAARLLRTYHEDILYVNNGFGVGVWHQDAWLIGTEEAASTVKRFAIKENTRLEDKLRPLTGVEKDDAAIKEENARVYGWMKQSQQHKVLTSTVSLLSTLYTPFKDYKTFDSAPLLLQVANGTLDLEKGLLREPRREDFLTVRSPVPYDPDAQCPNFLQFLERIFPGDREMLHYIQWLFGFSLIGHNLDQLIFFFEGGGSNGKSMLATIQRELLGEDLSWISDCRVLYQAKDAGNATRNSIAHYHKKRLVILSESDTDQRLAEAFVKAATGEETLVGEHKYGREFAVPISFKFIQLSQHLPTIYNQDWGIWRRVRIVPFNATISEDEKDRSFFVNTIQHELPGILRWAVEGTRIYHQERERDILPKVMKERMKSYKEDSDFFTRFVEENLEFTPHGFLPEKRLFAVASQWGYDHNIPTLQHAGYQYYKKAFPDYLQGKSLITHPVGRDRRRVSDGAQEGDNREYGFTGVQLSTEAEAMYTTLNRRHLSKSFGS